MTTYSATKAHDEQEHTMAIVTGKAVVTLTGHDPSPEVDTQLDTESHIYQLLNTPPFVSVTVELERGVTIKYRLL